MAFYDATTLALLNTLPAGALPDMLTFTPDGQAVLVANEGEPDDDYVVDPEGSVTIIDIRRGIERATARTVDFRRFDVSANEGDARGRQVCDSGSDFEWITANQLPDDFNSTNDENDSFDNRSDDKGPEPEGLDIGRVLGRQYAFIGLERIGGIMVYDITIPWRPSFETCVNNRDFSVADATDPAVGDRGPEGIRFVPWYDGPTWRPLLLVGNKISGTTTVYEVKVSFHR